MSQPADCAALMTDALSCGYRGHDPVLQEVSLTMRAGRLVCVIGQNGAGKSTLMQTIAGLLPPVSGTVQIRGRRLNELSARERAQVLSVVLTGQRPPGFMTVRRYVELGRYPHLRPLGRADESHRSAVEEALQIVGASPLIDRYVTELSDGERQRVSLARALAQSADVMLLDEPTAFLDVSGRAKTMDTLRSAAHSSGRLIITSSHDIELVLRVADTVILIRPDRTLATGAPEDLVLSKEFDHLFADSTLRFDYERGGFAHRKPDGPLVTVHGGGQAGIWTRHAVERLGFEVGPAAPRHITVPIDNHDRWSVTDTDGGQSSAGSLEELADLLRD